jgi:hypothetical protein
MNNSAKKVFIAGVALITAGAIAIAPTVSPPPPRPPAYQLSAVVHPLSQPASSIDTLVVDWLERIVIPPSLGAPVPTPPTVTIPTVTSIGGTIKNVYNAIEPWVRYGFELAAYVVGWIPYVGWLAPQITILYNFGERIARSITYNIADWLDGHVSFGQGLINVAVDAFNSLVQLGIDELHFFLPPLPPLPLAVKQTSLSAVQHGPSALPQTSSATKQSRVADPSRVPIRDSVRSAGSAAATTRAASSRVNHVGPESRAGAASVLGNVGNAKSVAQSVLSTFSTDSAGPVVGSLVTAKGPQNNVKRFDGEANATGNARLNGKK